MSNAPEVEGLNPIQEAETPKTDTVETVKSIEIVESTQVTESTQSIESTETTETVEQPAPIIELLPSENPEIEAPSDTIEPTSTSLTKEEILDKLKDTIEYVVDEGREQIEQLKSAFYKIKKAETDKLKKLFVSEGGNPEDFRPEEDHHELTFKELLQKFKEKRSSYLQEQELIKQANLEQKMKLLEDLKALVENTEEVSKHYNDFQSIQDKWKQITLIPQSQVTELWKSYHHYVERFYELLKINKELRDYDYKVNLGLKTSLCETAEKLVEEADGISAFHQLQNLHNEWREIGPVSKEQREEIWKRFKDASTLINKRHQDHFEQIKEKEALAEGLKIALCEKIETLELDTLNSFTAWEEKTQELLQYQEEWKKIGFASKKINNQLYDRFRTACNIFFEKKSDYFKNVKGEMAENYELKRQLCEAAEALRESDDWKNATDQLVKLQQEWKKIGAVSRKQSDLIWGRFIKSCDEFFERKNKFFSSQRDIETVNMDLKREVIEQLKAIQTDDTISSDDAISQIRELIEKWKSIGHVPFKEKDNLFKQFNEQLDRLFQFYNMKGREQKVRKYVDSITSSGDSNKIKYERERLIKQREAIRGELKTYENNIGFLTSNSKSGGALLKDILKKMDQLKTQIVEIEAKITAIETTL